MPNCEDTINSLHTIRDFLRWSVSQFNANNLWFGHGTDNAWDEAVQLVMVSLDLPPQGEERLLDARLTNEEKLHLFKLVCERIETRRPVPYLTGKSWFAGLMFHVDERVLIPRSPIAELIEHGFHPWLSNDPQRILDLCTGSGCIGIACAYAFPDADVMLSDISSDALAVASDNISLHNLENRVYPVKSDLFSGLSEEQFDLIVTNPPYVDAGDISSMPPEYQHEPELALASGDDGLDFTRRLLREAAGHLTDNGVLIVEVGNSWVALEEAFPELPFTWIEFERGGHGVFLLHRQDLLEFTNRL